MEPRILPVSLSDADPETHELLSRLSRLRGDDAEVLNVFGTVANHPTLLRKWLVFATYALTNDFSGAPSVVHGGVTLAILDEAMAWACIAVAKQWAVTTKTSTEFIGAMYVGKQYRVEARIDDRLDGRLRTTGVVVDGKGRARAQATASFTALGAAQARRVIGDDLGGHAADYLRP